MAQFTNQAQLTYNNAVINSNIAVGEILEVLSATKTAVRGTYGQQDDVTYIVSIVNSGNTPITGLTLTDDLGAYAFQAQTLVPLTYTDGTVRYYENGTLQATPSVTAGNSLVIPNISVPANGNAIIVYEAAVNRFAPPTADGSIENTVTITGTGISPVTASETVTAEQRPILGITKSVSPIPVTENGTLTYTFVIQNTGNEAADAADAIIVTDAFDPILSDLTVTFDGQAWTESNQYTYNSDTGLFTTASGQVTVPAATYAQDAATGAWLITPGVSTLVVSGTV